MHSSGGQVNKSVFTVKDMPHFAPYLQFLLNIVQIHYEYVRQGRPDHGITEAINKDDLDALYRYLYALEGTEVEIRETDARVLYACFVIVSRLLICAYGEEVCARLIKNLPPQHRWHRFETFRNDLLRHNAQMLMDMDENMSHLIGGLDRVKRQLAAVSL